MLCLIETVWKKNPDLRLCQLLSNCFVANDLYYKEDDDLYQRLKETYCADKKEVI